jgi:hypothetical protein
MHACLQFIFLLALTSRAWLSAAACAQSSQAVAQDNANVVTTVELSIAAAPEPRPALKYRLLPTISERKPGNAALHYYRAILFLRQKPKEYWQEYTDHEKIWTEAPKAEFPKEQIANWLAAQRHVFTEIRHGAYKEHCDWDFRLQDVRGPQLYEFLLPEIQECRQLARSLRIKARYEIFDGRPDDALETLRWGYQLARHVAQPPLLVPGLVGLAISSVMNAELEHLIAESPHNYYWAIAGVPVPLVDLRPALEFEMNAPFQVFPFLKDPETAERSPDEWRRIVLQCLRDLAELGGHQEFRGWQGELAAAALMAKLYPVAREALISAGLDSSKVESMPSSQVVAIHTARVTAAAYHDIFKLSLLPYDQAMARLPKTMDRLEKDVFKRDAMLQGNAGLPIANVFLPAVQAVLRADVRTARDIAALQAVEAIRLHAAAHGGQLPKSLADITAVPVPNNPATGQPFSYQLDSTAGTATLEVPTMVPFQPRQDGKRYTIRITK